MLQTVRETYQWQSESAVSESLETLDWVRTRVGPQFKMGSVSVSEDKKTPRKNKSKNKISE